MKRLSGMRVLVVEDDVLIAMDIEQLLQDAGCGVVGPVASVGAAFRALEASEVDAAVLDINLNGELVFPVADALDDANIPFILVTGHTERPVPTRHRARPLVTKPYRPTRVIAALVSAISPKRARARGEPARSSSVHS
jgi:two-component SAPR family response regulator